MENNSIHLTAQMKSGILMLVTIVGLLVLGALLVVGQSIEVGVAFLLPTIILILVSRVTFKDSEPSESAPAEDVPEHAVLDPSTFDRRLRSSRGTEDLTE